MDANESSDAAHTQRRLAAIGEIAAEIAHELRNLLQVVASSGYAARLALNKSDVDTAQPLVAAIERTARTAHAIVDDLMALARGESLARETVLLSDVLAAAREDLAAFGAHWVDAVAPPGLELHAHPRLVARLLHVLYENAIQASATRTPTVTTRAHSVGACLVLEVADDGPGIPPDIADRVFDPLFTARSGGTGLGLALARRIAEAHGATLSLVRPASADETCAFRLVLAGGT